MEEIHTVAETSVCMVDGLGDHALRQEVGSEARVRVRVARFRDEENQFDVVDSARGAKKSARDMAVLG